MVHLASHTLTLAALLVVSCPVFSALAAERDAVFVGSTPCADPVAAALGIPADADQWIQWSLTLHRRPDSDAPAGYELRCSSRSYIPGSDGLSRETHAADRRGAWTLAKGVPSNPRANVFQLDQLFDLVQVSDDVLHLLNTDHSLMSRDGGWSWTLNNAEAAEPRPGPDDVVFPPSDSYRLTPLATGPDVFRIYVGRTPIQRIWHQLGRSGPVDAMKAKWRLTLFHDPATGLPTRYRIDGTLYREGLMKDPQEPREGEWRIVEDPATKRVIYELGPCKSEPGLGLLVGDENVLFVLDDNRQPLVGSLDFSYTLNRRRDIE